MQEIKIPWGEQVNTEKHKKLKEKNYNMVQSKKKDMSPIWLEKPDSPFVTMSTTKYHTRAVYVTPVH